jgi:hypothetical protein
MNLNLDPLQAHTFKSQSSVRMSGHGVRSFCLHYPSLTDVWMSHLLSFLLPDAIWMRKYMSTSLYELKRRMEAYWRYGQTPVCSDLCFNKYTSFWLDEHLVLVKDASGYYLHILHLSMNGIVHCINSIGFVYGFPDQLIVCGDVAVGINRCRVSYYMRGETGWIPVDNSVMKTRTKTETDNFCLRRAEVLYSIRKHNS